MKVSILAILILLSSTANPALAGSLRTWDGKSYDGEIRVQSPGYFLVVPKVGSLVKVEPANVLDASLVSSSSLAMARGIVLADGTALAAASIDSITDDAVRITRSDGKSITLPTKQIARVIFKPVTSDQLAKIPAATAGVLLANGDFNAGQFRSYDGHSVRVESVLFGIVAIPTGDKAIALVLHDAQPPRGNLVVQLTDGSILTGESFELDDTTLKMTAGLIGPIAINGKTLAQIHAGGDRMQSLADMSPTKIDGGDAHRVFAIDATTIGLPARLRDQETGRVIGISAGASATYALEGRYKFLLCSAGVPMNALPTGQVRFIVLVDGKLLFQSPWRSSMDDPLNLSVKLNRAQTMTLKIEADSIVGGGGIWCDPMLLKAQPQP